MALGSRDDRSPGTCPAVGSERVRYMPAATSCWGDRRAVMAGAETPCRTGLKAFDDSSVLGSFRRYDLLERAVVDAERQRRGVG
jgi:hypothetical protein